MRSLAFNALNAFNIKKNVLKYDYNLRSLFVISIRTEIQALIFCSAVQGRDLSIAYETHVQHPNKTHCVRGGVMVRNLINSLLVCF